MASTTSERLPASSLHLVSSLGALLFSLPQGQTGSLLSPEGQHPHLLGNASFLSPHPSISAPHSKFILSPFFPGVTNLSLFPSPWKPFPDTHLPCVSSWEPCLKGCPPRPPVITAVPEGVPLLGVPGLQHRQPGAAALPLQHGPEPPGGRVLRWPYTHRCKLCCYGTQLKANFQLHLKTDKHAQK